jgi:hypothetical protein
MARAEPGGLYGTLNLPNRLRMDDKGRLKICFSDGLFAFPNGQRVKLFRIRKGMDRLVLSAAQVLVGPAPAENISLWQPISDRRYRRRPVFAGRFPD